MNNKSLDLTNIPKELHLILELLRAEEGQSVDEARLKDIDWEVFIDLSMHHRIYPVLFNKLKSMAGNNVPSFVMKTIHQQYQRNTFQMLHYSAEMEKVSRLFSEHHIRLLFLKGPNLGHDLYGDISLRTSGDLDVLIPIGQLEEAEELLVKAGYEKDDYIQTVFNDWKWRHHHVTYIHPQKRIKLELHWRLNPGPAKEPCFNDLWRRKRQSALIKFPVFTLGKEDLFVFLASHGARHGWSRLRWLLDIHQLLNLGLDWQQTQNLLKESDYLEVGGQAVILASQLLHTTIPAKMKTILKNKKSIKLAKQAIFYLESMINLHTEPLPIEVSRYHKHHLFSLMSTPQKFFFVLSFLHPYPEDAETLPLPKQLHFLYFPLRPFLWAWRKTRKHALT